MDPDIRGLKGLCLFSCSFDAQRFSTKAFIPYPSHTSLRAKCSAFFLFFFLQPPSLLLGDQRVCKQWSYGSHNQSLKHRGYCWIRKRKGKKKMTSLSLYHLFTSQGLDIPLDQREKNTFFWGEKKVDRYSRFLNWERFGTVRGVAPGGNTPGLTWVKLALYVSVTPHWWKNMGGY